MEIGILDLRNAYLQIRVHEDLWKHQSVQFKGKFYALTRLGFGLNCAPRIMSVILRKVLSLDARIESATDHYIDDIVVNESIVSVAEVSSHLARYGLRTKPAETFETSRVLGLQLYEDKGNGLSWKRGNVIPKGLDQNSLTKRELFSICGKLIGHYPVVGWLRVACSFIKRHSDGHAWEDDVGDLTRARLSQVLERLRKNDPVRGSWSVVNNGSGNVWSDASSLAFGVVLEVGGKIVEDASWLRKKDDGSHINVAELEAVIKGLNIALKWSLREITLITDSATVHSWLESALSSSCRVKVGGLYEMLVRRRLSVIMELRTEFNLELRTKLVKSCDNKADELTRVPQLWLLKGNRGGDVRRWHEQHHFGVDRTLYLARQVDSSTRREEVEEVVRSCERCHSIDPAPVRWDCGELGVEKNWQRLAIDVTHYHNEKYLTIIDCGPSRFAIWRLIASEEVPNVVTELEQVFREKGPPSELLMDNSASFRSKGMGDLCQRWNVLRRFRCAYRPAGNAIIERNHRTIKSRAERAKVSPLEIVFWYNLAPSRDSPESAPAASLHSYLWRNPNSQIISNEEGKVSDSDFTVGDKIFVKPPNARCTTRWVEGVVTATPSRTSVEVNGIPRHVADCRQTPAVEKIAAETESAKDNDPRCDDGDGEPVRPGLRRSTRERRPPAYLSDFECDLGGCNV